MEWRAVDHHHQLLLWHLQEICCWVHARARAKFKLTFHTEEGPCQLPLRHQSFYVATENFDVLRREQQLSISHFQLFHLQTNLKRGTRWVFHKGARKCQEKGNQCERSLTRMGRKRFRKRFSYFCARPRLDGESSRLHFDSWVRVNAIGKLQLQQFRCGLWGFVGFWRWNISDFQDLQNGEFLIGALKFPLAEITDARSNLSEVALKQTNPVINRKYRRRIELLTSSNVFIKFFELPLDSSDLRAESVRILEMNSERLLANACDRCY